MDDGTMDYPTITQVVDAVEESSITPVFAIGRTYENMYQVIRIIFNL